MKTFLQGISTVAFQRGIVCFFMVLMSVQIIGIEGMGISSVKAVAMSFSFVVLLFLMTGLQGNLSVVLYAGIYLAALTCCCLVSSNVVVWDRVIYRGMFLATFACVYLIIHSGNVPIALFGKLLTFIVCAYGCAFILQWLCFMVGIREFLPINLTGALTMGGGLKANGLAIEPSHAGRILAFVYWGELALTDIINGRELTFVEQFKTNRFSSISFWMTMLFMGSATAMLGAAIVGIHFFKRHLSTYLFGIIAVIVFLNVDFHIETIDRLKNVIDAFLSDDTVTALKEKESSGGSRIAPMINTITHLDLFSLESWIGRGSDNIRVHAAMFTTQRIGDINDFGLITYILSLVFVYKCCIRKFFCLETLLFAILLGFSIGSLYTCWCGMMVCTAIRYYSQADNEEFVEVSTEA